MVCFEPLLLAGYLLTLQPNATHVSRLDAPLIEMQSCERGVGLDARAATSGVFGLMGQYGFQWQSGDWSYTLIPKAGLGYHDVMLLEQQSKLNFSLDAQFLIGYKSGRVGLEYWHMSNAGLGDRNAGLDVFAATFGWKF